MIYVTGDTHGRFNHVANFCQKNHTTKDDILIILGDAGINYHRGYMDIMKKDFPAELPVTLLCVHGNHEQRPFTIPTYTEQEWHGGIVYVEDEYPSILFAKDGEVYDLDGQKAVTIGGAYSIDKMFLPGVDQSRVDKSTEEWLGKIEERLEYRRWYCGHYHTEKEVDRVRLMFEKIEKFR